MLSVLALSRNNSNAGEIVLFLHRLVLVLVEYFKELEEESIRDNFVIIYELLDEMMDFGYPQTTESKILQECVYSSALHDRRCERRRIGTSLRSRTSLKYKYDHQLQSQTRCHGDLRVSVTGRTRSSWMSLRVSTYW